jgi:hypothetical protein
MKKPIVLLVLILVARVLFLGCVEVKGNSTGTPPSSASYSTPPADGGLGTPSDTTQGGRLETRLAVGVQPDALVETDVALKPSALCHPRPMRFVTTSHFEEPHTSAAICEIDDQGVFTMSYGYPKDQKWCPLYEQADGSKSGPYRACFFSQNEDVSDFERGYGLYEVRFCFEGPLFENLDLWFNAQADGTPLSVMRLHSADDATRSSCQTMFLSFLDGCTTYGKTQCGRPCSDVLTPDAGLISGGAHPSGSDAATLATSATACSSFQRVKARLTTEYCTECATGDTCARPEGVEIRLLSLVYYPSECLCQDDRDCATGTFCRKDGLSLDADCWKDASGCRGICVP